MPTRGPDVAPHNLTGDINSPAPYVATASSETLPAWQAFDGNGATAWMGGTTPAPSVNGCDGLQIDLGAGNEVYLYSYAIGVGVVPGSLSNGPTAWCFFGSPDGLNWDLLDQQSGIAWTVSPGQTQEFTVNIWPTAYRFFQVCVINIGVGGSFAQINEMFLYQALGVTSPTTRGSQIAPTTMVSDTSPAPFVASASSEPGLPSTGAWDAFNKGIPGNFGVNLWFSATNNGWLQIDLGSPAVVTSYSILNSFNATDSSPVAFILQGSNDGSTWTTMDTRAGQVLWSRCTFAPTGLYSFNNSRWYICSASGSYRYIRLTVSLVGFPGGDDLEIQELYLYGCQMGGGTGKNLAY